MCAQQAITSVGLVLNAAGVLVLYVWQPPGVLGVLDAHGGRREVKLGRPFDGPRSRWGLALVIAGTLAQGVAAWM